MNPSPVLLVSESSAPTPAELSAPAQAAPVITPPFEALEWKRKLWSVTTFSLSRKGKRRDTVGPPGEIVFERDPVHAVLRVTLNSGRSVEQAMALDYEVARVN